MKSEQNAICNAEMRMEAVRLHTKRSVYYGFDIPCGIRYNGTSTPAKPLHCMLTPGGFFLFWGHAR